jgi:ADP-ribose pyrophosphatase YjhB (NUDIX family)
MTFQWLEWAQKLQAIAQTGLTYRNNPFDSDRYDQILQIAAEIMATGANEDPTHVLDLFTQESGHATPKVEVRGAVFQDDKLLLVQERDDGLWTLPGGWVDVGESASRAIEREIFEESGYETQAIKLLAVYDRSNPRHGFPPVRHQVYKLFFQCKLIGGTATGSIETKAVEFFAESEIPELSSARVGRSHIDRLFEYYRNPDLPTEFD